MVAIVKNKILLLVIKNLIVSFLNHKERKEKISNIYLVFDIIKFTILLFEIIIFFFQTFKITSV